MERAGADVARETFGSNTPTVRAWTYLQSAGMIAKIFEGSIVRN